jgi:hypothetical protein
VFRLPVLLLAIALTSPALWSALVTGSMSLETAIIRFLIAMPIAALMTMAFRATVRLYERDSISARRREMAHQLAAKEGQVSPDRQS